VDGILATLVANGLSSGTSNLSGGTNAIPDAAGLANKAILVSRSWTVTVNSASYCAVNVDLSGHTELTSLDLNGCTIMQTLNVSGCTNLVTLNLTGCTNLTTLNTSGCTSLIGFMGSLNLAGCTALVSVNASGCTSLSAIYVDGLANLTTVNVANCTSLADFNEGGGSGCVKLSSLTITGCTNLTRFWMTGSLLTSIDFTGCSMSHSGHAFIFNVWGNNLLTSITIGPPPSMPAQSGDTWYLNSNALTQACVDAIVAYFENYWQYAGGAYLDVSSPNNESPSTAGYASIDNLWTGGWSVYPIPPH
jgi:hypothetical protein